MTVTDDQIDQFLAAASPFIGHRSGIPSSRWSVLGVLRRFLFGSDTGPLQATAFQSLTRSGYGMQAPATAFVAGDDLPRPA